MKTVKTSIGTVRRNTVKARLILFSVLAIALIVCSFFSEYLTPYDPYLQNLDIAKQAPTKAHPLGTDRYGRDMLSRVIAGSRASIFSTLLLVAVITTLGTAVGVTCGWVGGLTDTVLMRVCDVMLSFPAILVALLADGILRSAFPGAAHESVAYFVLIFAITLSGWVPYARTVRGLTLVEKGKEFVMAAELIGEKKLTVMRRHILPNVLGPVFVLAAVNVATAVMTEATLSFLGVGVPPTTPSLGTLIRIGNDYLFSGEWWICIFPGIVLIAVVLAVNLLGDWLRDAVNPGLP